MKRFYKQVAVEEAEGGYRVALDGRAIRTQGGRPQIVPSRALAEAMAGEWRDQAATIDTAAFFFRDAVDYAIDMVRPRRAASIGKLLGYAETDTLCYRADPDEPLYRRQHELWEPLLTAAEQRHGIRFERVSGIVHRAQPPETLERLRTTLEAKSDFELAALETLAPLAASLTLGLAALEPDADAETLFAAANCEQDWQAELWGWDHQAENDRATRLAAFKRAMEFARLVRARGAD